MRKKKHVSASNPIRIKRASADVVAFDFEITATTDRGQRVTSTIPAGTPRSHLRDFFKIIGYPPFLYNGNNRL